MCSNIFKYLFQCKSKKETDEPDVTAFRSRAEPMQEQRRRLFSIDEEWEEEYEASFDTVEEDELLDSFNILDELPSTPDSLKWRKQGAKPKNLSDACSSNSYFSYENARRRRPLSKEAIDYQPTFTNAAKKLSEGKQSLEKPDAKEEEKPGMDKEEKHELKKKEKETNALFMLEEDYHRRHEDSYGWTI